jgi:hypothetical protein
MTREEFDNLATGDMVSILNLYPIANPEEWWMDGATHLVLDIDRPYGTIGAVVDQNVYLTCKTHLYIQFGHEIYHKVGFSYGGKSVAPVCECGSDSVKSPKHSDWCPKVNLDEG